MATLLWLRLACLLCISAALTRAESQGEVSLATDGTNVIVSTLNANGTLAVDGLDIVATLERLLVCMLLLRCRVG